jgi:hypothetical protein
MHLKRRTTAHLRGAATLILLCLASITAPAKTVATQWTLRDYFHRNWQNELVTYPVDAKTAANKNLMLIGADGKAHSYQWLKAGAQTNIAFLADVPADGTSTYRLAAGQPQTQTDLHVEETANTIRLYNNQTGVEIRKVLGEGEAPIAAIRLASGHWIGGSQRLSTPALQSYAARVVERGPVLCEVLCEAKFEGGKNWRMRFRLLANEPVATVSESSNVGAGASWRLRLDNGFAPTRVFRRNPRAVRILTEPLATTNGTVGVVEPWVQWWEPTHGSWLSFYNEQSNDLLALGALNPSLWVDLDKLRAKTPQSPPAVPIIHEDGALYANFDLTGGLRRWTIASLDKNASLKVLDGKDIVPDKLTLPHSYVIKYGDFPLDRVKDYVLDWPDKVEHPHLLVNRDDIARLKRTFKVEPDQLKTYQDRKLTNYSVFDAMPVYLATGDEKVGRHIADIALAMLQAYTDSFLIQEGRGSLGTFPVALQGINPTLCAVDVAWPALTPEERKRVKAQVALIGYAVDSPDYWSLERGFHANPNMTTMVASYQAGAGYFLADHPLSDKWIADGMAEAKDQITNWADAEGGWLESPHYASVSYDNLLGMFLMARSKDNGALLYSDTMKKVATFLAKVATPPDVNVGGLRHQPRIGNGWLDEPTGVFGVLAGLWKEKDSQFASEMQWMYQQQGSWPYNGIGGRYPSFEGIRPAFLDPTIPAKKPDYKSTWFPKTGVSLRNGVDDRETQLYMIAGPNHEHYDNDSGSITLWGKGRVVANDFSYAEAAGHYHSFLEGGGRSGLMYVQSFKSTPHFDAVRGMAGGWQRQIAFVKDSDMMAPNYFVLRDTISTPAAAIWRLWLDGKVNILDPKGNDQGMQMQKVQLEGRNDVDTDIALITSGGVPLTTEDKTDKLFGLGPDKKTAGNREYSLSGLIANLGAGQNLLTVIYPRLKTQKPPKITVLAEGRAVKVEHEAGTDYVFLSDKSFTFDEGDIHFEGMSGLVKIRGEKVLVALGEGSKLTARGQSAAE